MKVFRKLIKIDKIFFDYYFYSRYKLKRNKTSLRKHFSHKYFVYYDQEDQDLLSQLCIKYGSNKGGNKLINLGSKVLPPHTYTDFYSQIFKFGREKVMNVFECGIGTNNPYLQSTMGNEGKPGASLYVWRDFFPNANIYGGDIDKDILFNTKRIKTGYLDQTNEESVESFFKAMECDEFDIMIDDGLHTFEANKTLFLAAQKYISKGLYIIEDVSQNEMSKYIHFVKDLNLNAKFINLYRPNLQLGDNSLLLISP
jgi:hypothetical protein